MTVAQTQLAPARPPAIPERLRALRGRLSRSQAGFGYLLAAPALVVIIIAALATPIVLLVLYSFWTQDYVTVDTTLTLDNYRTILDRPIYFSVMLRSIISRRPPGRQAGTGIISNSACTRASCCAPYPAGRSTARPSPGSICAGPGPTRAGA